MTDTPPVAPAPSALPVGPRIAAMAILIRALGETLCNGFKELAPYLLVGIVVFEVVRPVPLSAFATHVLDGVFGAGLMAIKGGGKGGQ